MNESTVHSPTLSAALSLMQHARCFVFRDSDGEEVCAIVRLDRCTPTEDTYPGMYVAYHSTKGLVGHLWGVDDAWLAAYEAHEEPLFLLPLPLVTFACLYNDPFLV